MRRFRKIAVVCLVWATAASTLLGSTPHVVCRCPNGQIKFFCSISTFTKSSKSCCCNGSCCASQGSNGCCCKAKSEKKPSCCNKKNSRTQPENTGKQGLPTKGKVGDDAAFGGSCCQKTLVEAKVQVLNQEKKSMASEYDGLLLLAVADSGFSVIPVLPQKMGWRVDWSPPPTDLVTSLQRLNI